MRLTTFSDYTLRTMIYLALQGRSGGPAALCTIDEIAAAYGISANHLTKVVHQSAQAGDIQTVRGQGGGLRLARPPETINVGAVLRRTEPDMALAACFATDGTCPIQPACILQGALSEALAAFLAVMDRWTLADLVQPKHQLRALLQLEPATQTP